MFKDLKKTMESAQQAGQASAQLAQSNQALVEQYDVSSLSPDDPGFEPIEGVTLEKYAELCAGLVKNQIGTEENVEAWVEAQGVSAGTWKTVSEGWNKRMGEKPALAMRYGDLYTRAST